MYPPLFLISVPQTFRRASPAVIEPGMGLEEPRIPGGTLRVTVVRGIGIGTDRGASCAPVVVLECGGAVHRTLGRHASVSPTWKCVK